MKKLVFITLVLLTIISCNQQTSTTIKVDNTALNKMFDNYYEDRMKLYPMEATQNGDNRYNDQLPIYITESFKDTLHDFYTKYLNDVEKYDTATLDENDLISYKIFDREMKMQLEALDLNISLSSRNGLPVYSVPAILGFAYYDGPVRLRCKAPNLFKQKMIITIG